MQIKMVLHTFDIFPSDLSDDLRLQVWSPISRSFAMVPIYNKYQYERVCVCVYLSNLLSFFTFFQMNLTTKHLQVILISKI